MRWLYYWKILRLSITRFVNEDALTQSAALAYFMVFSLPPMLVIILWAAGFFFEEALVREAVFFEIGSLVGEEGSRQLMVTIEGLDIQEPSWWAKLVAAAVLLFSASTVLIAGKNAVNRIFGVKAADSAAMSIWRMLFDRLFSFAMLVTFAFILSVSMVLDASINMIGAYLQDWVGQLSTVMTIVDSALLDWVATALVFVMLFRYLPDVKLRWEDIWFGALLTTLLFEVGKYLIGFLIGQSEIVDLYDVAGSVLVLMVWVYYASAIFLFAATLTSTRANLR